MVGAANPIMPLYAATFNVSFTIVGFVVGVFGISRLMFEVPGGVWGDKYGRRKVLTVALIMFTASGVLAFFASDIVTLAIARFIQGIGTSLYTGPSLALLGDIAPKETRAKFIATYYSYDWFGTAMGPAIGGYLSQYSGFKSAFLVIAIISGMALILTYAMIPETRISGQVSSFRLSDIPKAAADWRILLLCCIGAPSFFIASGVRNTAIPLLGKSQGISLGDIGLILTLALIINSLANMVGRKFIDRIGMSRILLVSYLTSAVFLTLIPAALGFSALLTLTSLLTLSLSLVPLIYTDLIIEITVPENRGLYFSIFRIFGDVGTIVGPLMVGVLFDLYGLASSFYISAIICLATFLPRWGLRSLIKKRAI